MMKKIFYLLLVSLPLHHHGYTQKRGQEQIDSLLTKLSKANEDTTKVNLFAAIMAAHVYYKTEEGLVYQKPALELAQKLNWKMGVAKVKDRTGRLYWRMGKFDAALKNHFEALAIYEKAGDNYRAYVMVEIAQDYLDNGKYDEGEIYLLKALKISEAANDKPNMSAVYDKLSYLYSMQGNISEATNFTYRYLKVDEEMGNKNGIANAAQKLAFNAASLGNNQEALQYFKQGLQAVQGDKLREAKFNGHIGFLYSDLGDYPQAMRFYSDAITSATLAKDVPVLADIHNGMGNIYIAQGKFTEALNHYLIAETAYKSVANKMGLAEIYVQLGTVYTRLKKYGEANKNFKQAIELSRQMNSTLLMPVYYSGLQLLDSATGNWKNAYQHYKQYIFFRDSNFNKETLKKMVASQMRFESDKKEAITKAVQEKKDIEVQGEMRRQRKILYSAFAVLSMMLLFSVVVFRQRNKIAKEKKRSDQLLVDKELLIREVHHRVKNNLEVVSSLLALQSAQIDDPNTKEAMQEGQNRVHSIGIVHQKLYQGETLGAIEMKDYFLNLSESILDSFGAEKRVQIVCAMDALNIDIDTAVPLGLIVNELLTNTLKYAFPDGRKGNVEIKLEKRNDGMLQLQVSDNGVGKSGLTQGTGFGGQLISLLTKQLGGTMREENNNGTHIFFEFKMDKAA